MGADIMTECNGCFGSLFECNHILQEDEDKKAKINANLAEIGREYKGTINVKHFAQILRDDVGFEKLASLIEKPLDLNVAVHYGCHFLKPTKTIGIEDQAENPSILDDLVEITGAKSVDYNEKYGTDFALPVFHLAQLYGLAMGLSADDLTFDAQQIDATPAIKKALGE